MLRENIDARLEAKEIIIADIALIFAFTMTLDGGIEGMANVSRFISHFIYLLPIVALGVTLSFILHELMHKFSIDCWASDKLCRFRLFPCAVDIIWSTERKLPI